MSVEDFDAGAVDVGPLKLLMMELSSVDMSML
jgi:hypothetical protein